MIRVMIVEDSPIALIILKRLLSASSEISIVATAKNGVEAWQMLPQVMPDVVCTDLHMAQMDGLELTKLIMKECPRPILVISTSVQKEDTHNVFKLLEAGAVDIFPKPKTGLPNDYEKLQQELITKIKVLAGVKVFTRRSGSETKSNPVGGNNILNSQGINLVNKTVNSPQPTFNQTLTATKDFDLWSQPRFTNKYKMVAIGASTGGPQALRLVLSSLPGNFPVPVICVQHISEGFLNEFISWLGNESKLLVKIAFSGELPTPGTVYFPPERHHLLIDYTGRFVCSTAPPFGGHQPSVTVTLESVAKFYGHTAVGVLLTGMGRDGADGMQAIAKAGGLTIAQDESTSVVFGMPREAIMLGAAQYILPIQAIGPTLVDKIK